MILTFQEFYKIILSTNYIKIKIYVQITIFII